jgi:hypothetical protein
MNAAGKDRGLPRLVRYSAGMNEENQTTRHHVSEVNALHIHCSDLSQISELKNSQLYYFSELLCFWTLSIVRSSKQLQTQRFGNWICFFFK